MEPSQPPVAICFASGPDLMGASSIDIFSGAPLSLVKMTIKFGFDAAAWVNPPWRQNNRQKNRYFMVEETDQMKIADFAISLPVPHAFEADAEIVGSIMPTNSRCGEFSRCCRSKMKLRFMLERLGPGQALSRFIAST